MKPKPMVEIGGKPILWHIMKIYSYYGFNDFIILLGYKGYIIKEFFANYHLHQCDVTFDIKHNEMEISVSYTHLDVYKRQVKQRGVELLRNPSLNKGSAFTVEERISLGLVGLLPPEVTDLDNQIYRVVLNFHAQRTPLDKYIYLRCLLYTSRCV